MKDEKHIFGVHGKIRFLGVDRVGVTKNQYIGGIAYIGRAWTVSRFEGGFVRKRGWYFLGVWG